MGAIPLVSIAEYGRAVPNAEIDENGVFFPLYRTRPYCIDGGISMLMRIQNGKRW